MIRLSIIIPFYNVEKYITQCLDSVYNQDIPEDEYEVICVNDASPDCSRDIVIEYQKTHKNLILVEHKYNKKLGAARNTGRTIAQGKYIWNVDSDDYIAENCLGSILDQCEQNSLDILMFNLATDNGLNVQEADFFFSTSKYPQDGLICLSQNISVIGNFCPVWRYVYSRDFLDKKAIYSPEINMGEDVPYAFKALLLAKKVLLVNRVYYNYRINPTSLTGTATVKPTVLYERCFVGARLVYQVMQYISKEDGSLIRAFKNVVRNILYMYPTYFMNMSKSEKKIFAHICRKNIIEDHCLFLLMNKRNKLRYILCLLIF